MLGASALGAALLAFLIVGYHKAQIEGQNERNAYVKDQITQVDAKIKEIEELDKKKARLLARKQVIEQLQANRSQMVHLFDSLVRTIPDGVMLTSIKQDNEILTLEGRSQSNARVSTYMRNLEGSGWMTNPELAIIEARGEDKGLPYVFKLQVKLANPNAPRDEDGDGIPDPLPVDTEVAPVATDVEAAPAAMSEMPADTVTAPAAEGAEGGAVEAGDAAEVPATEEAAS